ncbi:MAG: helix-turn-helix domain-containing protein [Rhodopirellula sp.]|nr:helix-turn-helix domain-containing protein [Rhodopirellula sp.]
MAARRNALKLSRQEVSDAFAAGDWANRFPPLLTVDDAAELLRVPKSTIYQWHSSGRLTG